MTVMCGALVLSNVNSADFLIYPPENMNVNHVGQSLKCTKTTTIIVSIAVVSVTH